MILYPDCFYTRELETKMPSRSMVSATTLGASYCSHNRVKMATSATLPSNDRQAAARGVEKDRTKKAAIMTMEDAGMPGGSVGQM